MYMSTHRSGNQFDSSLQVNCNGFTIEDEELSHLGSAVFPEWAGWCYALSHNLLLILVFKCCSFFCFFCIVVVHIDFFFSTDLFLYHSVALMNHSCNPNVIVTYKGTVAEVRAVQKISPGEEVRMSTAFQILSQFDHSSRVDCPGTNKKVWFRRE